MNAPIKHEADIYALAREALAKCDGNTGEAAKLLDKRLLRDKALRMSIIEQAVSVAVTDAARRAHIANRYCVVSAMKRRAVRQEQQPVKNGATPSAAIAFSNAMTRTILDFPLTDGTPLRDAGREHLERALTHYRKQANSMNARANFFARILEMLPENKTVGQALDAETVQAAWDGEHVNV